MVILEGWAAGAPTLMSAECNLPEGFAAGAAIECGFDAATLAPLLLRAARMDASEWLAMAGAAHDLATGPFAARGVTRRWAECYRALASDAPVQTLIGTVPEAAR